VITYRKTQQTGEWVAFGPVSEVRVGAVTVEKRSGEKKQEQVVRLGNPFPDGGIMCVYGYLAPKAASQAAHPAPAPTGQDFGARFKPRNPDRIPERRDGRCKEPGCHAPAWRGGFCKQCWFDEYDC
jgi:hypothetical protein